MVCSECCNWGVSEVAAWIGTLKPKFNEDTDTYQTIFTKHEIDGPALCSNSLNLELLEGIGIQKAGHRLKLYTEIEKLKQAFACSSKCKNYRAHEDVLRKEDSGREASDSDSSRASQSGSPAGSPQKNSQGGVATVKHEDSREIETVVYEPGRNSQKPSFRKGSQECKEEHSRNGHKPRTRSPLLSEHRAIEDAADDERFSRNIVLPSLSSQFLSPDHADGNSRSYDGRGSWSSSYSNGISLNGNCYSNFREADGPSRHQHENDRSSASNGSCSSRNSVDDSNLQKTIAEFMVDLQSYQHPRDGRGGTYTLSSRSGRDMLEPKPMEPRLDDFAAYYRAAGQGGGAHPGMNTNGVGYPQTVLAAASLHGLHFNNGGLPSSWHWRQEDFFAAASTSSPKAHPHASLSLNLPTTSSALSNAGTLASELGDSNSPSQKPRPPRPQNAFLLFSNERRPILRKQLQNVSNADISRILGDEWKAMEAPTRARYIEQSAAKRQQFMEQYPDYVYTRRPSKRKKESS